jgi:hypothetical protein
MCGLCGALGIDHWAEAGGGRRARVFRVALLRRVLGQFGLALDEWGGSVYVLRDAKGSNAVVEDLGGIWQAAEELAGHPLDPLDPKLVRALRGDG